MEPDHWVWSKYGVGNGGGGIFLIGRDGIVVAVNPTVEEIEEYFKKSLDNTDNPCRLYTAGGVQQ